MESVAEFDGTLLADVHRILHHFHKVTVIHDFERFISCAALARLSLTSKSLGPQSALGFN